MKPLFRWTVGNCTKQGMQILEESVFRAMKAFGEDRFDWMICYNGMTKENRDYLDYLVQKRPIELVEQKWEDCAIPDNHWTPIDDKGRVEVDGKKCGGTLWKVSPARMDISRHEIVMDNDIVLLRALPVIEKFLQEPNKTLILEEPFRFYGRYEFLMPRKEYLNSGLMGFPPNYNFGACLLDNWKRHGSLKNLTQADEQGLLMYTLNRQPNYRITKYELREMLAKDAPEFTGEEYGLHFVQANRVNFGHRSWIHYCESIKNAMKFV